jgi:hypothetical protein
MRRRKHLKLFTVGGFEGFARPRRNKVYSGSFLLGLLYYFDHNLKKHQCLNSLSSKTDPETLLFEC